MLTAPTSVLTLQMKVVKATKPREDIYRILSGIQRFCTGSAIPIPSEGIFRCVAEAAAPVFWDWLTGGGVTRVFGRALSQDIFFSH